MKAGQVFFSIVFAAALPLGGCGSPDGDAPAATKPPLAPPTVCNGRAELCDRTFDKVAFPGTHNSMSNADDGWFPPNQEHGLRRQLDDGIRVMLIDTHEFEGGLYLCHSSCQIGSIPLAQALSVIKGFMDEHPYEVLTFIIEDNITPAQTEAAFKESGLIEYVFVHPKGEAWPTLREMLTTQKRLLVTAESGSPPPDWYQHAWDLIWDTPYSFTNTSEFSCDLNRGSKENDLFLMNHWLSAPLSDPKLAAVANEYSVLSGRAKQCAMEGGQIPNFVAVDFYSIGALIQVVDELNGF